MEAELTPVISYARISADTTRDAHGVADQHKLNRETAARYGMRVVAEVTDNDRSAAKADVVREGFEHMLRVVRAGKLPDGQAVRGVVVVADDRLVRRPGDYERFVDALTYEDGRVFADAKGLKNLYSEDVEAMGLFGVVISKMEVRKIQRRLRQSHRSRAEKGIPVGGTRPFGWNGDKLTLHPEEAPVLRTAIEDLIRGRSLNSICRQWYEAGLKTTMGNNWTARSVKLTLWNPRVCGWRLYKGELLRDASGEPVKGLWEPIVTTEQWQAVDAIFQARRGRFVGPGQVIGDLLPPDFRTARHLLTGILRCGRIYDGEMCNTSLRVDRKKGSIHHQYVCPSRAMGGCGGLSRRGDFVDEYVTEAVLAKLEERQAAVSRPVEWPNADKLARLVDKRSKLSQAWQEDEITDEIYFPTMKKMEAEIKELRAERSRYQLAAQRTLATEVDVRERWENCDLSQKRAIIFDALHAVIVLPTGGGRKKFNPDLLVPRWKGDEDFVTMPDA